MSPWGQKDRKAGDSPRAVPEGGILGLTAEAGELEVRM
jgi:hypothetical protein